MKHFKCKNCGITFSSNNKYRLFCSLSCSSTYNNSHGSGMSGYKHSIKTKRFLKKRMEGKQKGKDNYNWKGGIAIYRKLIKRDICILCGETNKHYLCIHHIDEDRYNNEPSNLLIVCQSCHRKIHYKGHLSKIKKWRGKNGRFISKNSV